jgi:Ca2+/Na+ antiporter
MPSFFIGPSRDGTFLILGAIVLVYIVARSAVNILAAERRMSVGRLAIANTLPIAAVAWMATAMGHADMAMGVMFGSSIAMLALVTGVALLGDAWDDMPPTARVWPFLVPVGVILIMMGFSAKLGIRDAVLLAAVGIVLVGVWRAAPPASPSSVMEPVETRSRPLLILRAILTLVLVLLAAWLAVRGAEHLAISRRGLSPGVVGVTLLSAMMVLPHVGVATLFSRHGRVGHVIGMNIGAVLMTLTLVLPVAIVIWHLRGALAPLAGGDVALANHPPFDWSAAAPMPFPIGFWRIESVILVALALPLVPVAQGKWKPGKAEGMSLLLGFLVYLTMNTLMGNRWH